VSAHTNICLLLLLCLAGCTSAFEVGEALNKATSNIANNPKVLWDTAAEAASAPAATTSAEPVVAAQPASAPAAAETGAVPPAVSKYNP